MCILCLLSIKYMIIRQIMWLVPVIQKSINFDNS